MNYSRHLSQIIAGLRAALPDARTSADGAITHDNALPSAAFHDIPECAASSLGGAAGDGASCCHHTPSLALSPQAELLREAFRANGWEGSVDALAIYSLRRMETARPETIKAMHDRLQAVCGELWKGIRP